MPMDHLHTDFLTFVRGASMAMAFHFPTFFIEGLIPELAAAVPDESVSGARAEIGTIGIRDSSASSKPGM
jgi:hypothetical protein